MRAYYNENDPKCAAWLRELIKEGLIADGDVDDRSIEEVQPADLRGYGQVHLFAGIGAWSYALRLAGVPDGFPVWTGSCPCQPYSVAGKRKGATDERNLWPHMFRLIRECRPNLLFSEQVNGAIAHGWLDGVSADLEAEAYAVGSVVLGAHSVGAPHIRQRVYWMAYAATGDVARRMPIQGRESRACIQGVSPGGCFDTSGLEHPTRNGRGEREAAERGSGGSSGMGESDCAGPFAGSSPTEAAGHRGSIVSAGRWADSYWLPCRDGRLRRVPAEPALFPLAHGSTGRVGVLRGAGNAIIPAVAATFIKAGLEAVREAQSAGERER